MGALSYQHDPIEWPLLSKLLEPRLKALMLHNGNNHPSVLASHAVDTTETSYYNMHSPV
jgi:hypothetical protein